MQQTATAAPPAGPARIWEATYPGTADQVRHVRAALRPLLRDFPLADDVLTLISELAANAVTHSDSRRPGGTLTVRLLHHPGSHIRGEVQDQGGTWDGDLTRSARPPHGLYLLLTLATRCGTEPGPDSRTAWFRIDYPQPPAGSSPAASSPAPRPGRHTASTTAPSCPKDTPMNDPQPSHPLPAMTSYELSRSRRELEHTLKSLPTSAAARARIQQQLTAVLAEQESRTQVTASERP